MPSIDQLLSRVVERKGYVVQGADPEALFARKGEESLLAAWKLDGPLSAAEAQLFLAALEQVRATSGILVAPRGADAAAREALSARQVDVWAESRLVHEVGEAYVHDAMENPPAAPAPARAPAPAPAAPRAPSKFPSLIAQAASAASTAGAAGAAMYMTNKPKAAADAQAHIPQKGNVLGYAWGGGGGGTPNPGIAMIRNGRNPRRGLEEGGTVSGAAPASPSYIVPGDDVELVSTPRRGAPAAPAAVEAPRPAPRAPPETEAYEILSSSRKPPAQAAGKANAAPSAACLKLNVTREDAVQKAQAKTGATVKLALVPHVTFEFNLHMERQGLPAPIEAHGALLINSLTGELRAVDGLTYADGFPADARKDQEKLLAVDVYDKVKSYMSKTYGRTMNVEREVAGNVVSSTLKIVPDSDEMGLEHKGIQYVPVWEITTSTGVTKVDAFTGAVLA